MILNETAPVAQNLNAWWSPGANVVFDSGDTAVWEFDGDDLFFGFVSGFERELGYFRLSELLENRGKLGMEIERDGSFRPTPLSKLKRL